VRAKLNFNAKVSGERFIISRGTAFFSRIIHCYMQVCVSVALWAASRPQLAFVFNPVLDQLFTAKRGHGAFLNGNRLSVSKTTRELMNGPHICRERLFFYEKAVAF
jgi:3'-phosphoadenosine 5'-phosphosulfate (PAPS) 3'-phosphatase